MPLFSWIKWPRGETMQAEDGATPAEAVPTRTLMRELQWHVEQREHLYREVAGKRMLGHQGGPTPCPLLPPVERRHLERLCAQIHPMHTPAVLCRFRKVLTRHNVLPWELVYVFKQVLGDFLEHEEKGDEEEDEQAINAWTNRCVAKRGQATLKSRRREEIPTISSYVEHVTRWQRPCEVHSDWDLPYCHPANSHWAEAYTTTL